MSAYISSRRQSLKVTVNTVSSSRFYEMLRLEGMPATPQFKADMVAELERGIGMKLNSHMNINTLIVRVFNPATYNRLGHMYINSLKGHPKEMEMLDKLDRIFSGSWKDRPQAAHRSLRAVAP